MKIAATATVHKLENKVASEALDISPMPFLRCETIVRDILFFMLRARVAFHLVRWAVHDIKAAAIRLPAGHSGSEILIRISETAIMFLLECILRCTGRIAALPECDDELVALPVG